MLENNVMLGGMLRKSQNLIMSAVQALWNPQNQNQYVLLTPGLYEGEEDGLAFYGGYSGGQFVQGLGAALTWTIGYIALRALGNRNSSLSIAQSILADCTDGMYFTPKTGYNFGLGYGGIPLQIQTPEWDISESSNGRYLNIGARNSDNCGIRLDRQSGNITFYFTDSGGSLSRLTIREIDDGILHG